MKLFYYLDGAPNFGDELNPWLFSRLIPDLLDEDASTILLGIGSILYDNFPADARKIVFGSGYAGYRPPPIIGETWKVYFVRGPRSASALKLDRSIGVGDAATLIRLLGSQLPTAGKPGGAVFMPHWESALDGVWELAAKEAGLGFIDPRWHVERVISAIRSSSLVVSEAMHGAIVADALRVPWIPFMPLQERHRIKWFDWAESLDLSITFAQSSPSSWNEWMIQRLLKRVPARKSDVLTLATSGSASGVDASNRGLFSRARRSARSFNTLGGSLARKPAVTALIRAAKGKQYLSADAVIERATEIMQSKIAELYRDVGRGLPR